MTTTSDPDPSSAVGAPAIEPVAVTLDSKGRVRASKEQRQVILAEFERSGMSAARFARRTGLKYSTLAGWLQRYRRARSRRRVPAVRLLEAVVAAGQPAGGQNPSVLVLELPGGARAEINDLQQVAWAAELLRALAKPC